MAAEPRPARNAARGAASFIPKFFNSARPARAARRSQITFYIEAPRTLPARPCGRLTYLPEFHFGNWRASAPLFLGGRRRCSETCAGGPWSLPSGLPAGLGTPGWAGPATPSPRGTLGSYYCRGPACPARWPRRPPPPQPGLSACVHILGSNGVEGPSLVKSVKVLLASQRSPCPALPGRGGPSQAAPTRIGGGSGSRHSFSRPY